MRWHIISLDLHIKQGSLLNAFIDDDIQRLQRQDTR